MHNATSHAYYPANAALLNGYLNIITKCLAALQCKESYKITGAAIGIHYKKNTCEVHTTNAVGIALMNAKIWIFMFGRWRI